MIITQELTNMAIKILKECFLKTVKYNIYSIVEQLLFSCTTIDHIMSMLKLNQSLSEAAIQAFEMAIPLIDEWYLNTQHRKVHFYKTNIHHRNITTIFGDLSFDRIYYTDKQKKNGFYLIDKLFNFEKYVTYSGEVRSILIDNSTKTNANLTSENTSFILGNYEDYLKKTNSRMYLDKQFIIG